MSAYMVILAEISDRDGFMLYARAAAEMIPKYGGEYVVRGPGESICLEGDWPDTLRTVISKWPSTEAAKAFWHSDEYAAIKKLRVGNAKVRVRLFEGVD